jgi:hypothetical protein
MRVMGRRGWQDWSVRIVRVYLISTFIFVFAWLFLGSYTGVEHNAQGEYCAYSVDPRTVNFAVSDIPCRLELDQLYLEIGVIFLVIIIPLHIPAYIFLTYLYVQRRQQNSDVGEFGWRYWTPIAMTFLVITGVVVLGYPTIGAARLWGFANGATLCENLPNWYSVVRIEGGAEECRLPRGMILENAVSLAVAMAIGLQWPAYLYFAARWVGRRTLAARR